MPNTRWTCSQAAGIRGGRMVTNLQLNATSQQRAV
jgi:hypothetical protein